MKSNIVSICGFGWSGSGAIVDLLREYDDLDLVEVDGQDFECTFLYDLACLDHSINMLCSRLSSADAVQTFRETMDFYSQKLGYEKVFKGHFKELTDCFVDSITDFSFYGWTFSDIQHPSPDNKWKDRYNWMLEHVLRNRFTVRFSSLTKLRNKLRKKVGHNMTVAYKPENFDQVAQNYVENLLDLIHIHPENPLVLDQGFPPDNPRLVYKYLDNPKSIVVRRDPRDTYLLAKCGITYMAVPLPVANVDDFICFYKKVIQNTKIDDSDDIMSLYFEDLIYNYDYTIQNIQRFLGISMHSRPLTSFNPQVSVNNTNLKLKYPEYADDIAKIESALGESLYPFEKYNLKHNSKDVF